MDPSAYRFRFLLDVCRAIFLPSTILALLLRLSGRHLGFLVLPCHAVFIIFWGFSRSILISWSQAQERKSLNANAIPRVVGKWPGNIDILLRIMKAFKTRYVADVYLELFEEYRCTTLNTRILWIDQIITMDQEHCKFVLATGFQHFWRGVNQKERLETFLGAGIFNRDDEQWKLHRNMARPFFARERISDFEIFEKFSSKTLAILSSSDSPCEVQDLYARFTMDAASEFLFGKNLDTLSATLPVPGAVMGPKGSATDDTWGSFTQSFEMAQQVGSKRARLGYFWPLFELFGDQSKPHAEGIHRFLDPLVSQALEDKRKAERANVTRSLTEKNFLQHLAESTDDPIVIRDQILNILLASRDTTACLLTFTTYLMALHPDVTKKLRNEVLEHCGSDAPPTSEQIRKLKYMRATFNEVLRLFPPVPLNVRETRPASCLLPPSDATYESSQRPLYMPKNTVVCFLPVLTQRNPALWGPDADIFDPDRWLNQERLSKFVANPTMFTPFSAGPRICIGQSYAYNEASYFLIRLLQRFDTFTLASDCQPEGSLPPEEWKYGKGRQAFERIWPAAAITLYIKGGLWVRFGKSDT